MATPRSRGADGRPPVTSSDTQPPGTRIRLVRNATDLDALPHLDDEDKAVGHEVIEWFEHNLSTSVTNTMGMWLNDPKFEKAYHFEFHGALGELCKELQPDPEKTGSYVLPGSVLNLIFLTVAKHFHWTWGMGALAATTPHVDGFDAEQIFMLDFPESEVWSDEQRLALTFVKAVLTLSVTDELMASALEMWGVKLTIRYIGMIGSLTTQALFMSAFNVAGRWNDAPGAEEAMIKGPARGWNLEEPSEPIQ